MAIRRFGKLKLLCIAVTLAVGACGGGSDPLAPTPEPEVVVTPMPDSKSVLTLRLLDTGSQAASTGPLKTNQFDGFSFLLNGNPIVVRSRAINTARSYADLRFAIEGAINALKPSTPALANFVVTLGANYTLFDVRSGLPVVGQSIVLTDTGGGIITVSPIAGWLNVEGLVTPGTIYNEIIDSSPAPAPVPGASTGVSPARKAFADPAELAQMVAQARKNGATGTLIVLVPTSIAQLADPNIRPELVQRKNLLLAELGKEAWDGGRLYMDRIGSIRLYVTEAGLNILQNSTNAESFRFEYQWTHSKLSNLDGSLNEIDRLLDSQGYLDAVVTLNVDGLEFDTLKDGGISFRTTPQTIEDGRAIARVVINGMNERQLPARSAAFAAIDTMMAPTLTLRLTREGVLKLALDDWVRTLKPVGFLGAQHLSFGANVLEEAQRAGSARVIITIRTPMLGGNPSRASVTAQTQAHKRALDGVLAAAGLRDTSRDADLSTLGAMAVQLTYAQLLAIKNSNDARLLAVELNRPVATPG